MNEGRYREAERRLWASVGVTPTERRARLERTGLTVRAQEVGQGPAAVGRLMTSVPPSERAVRAMFRRIGLRQALEAGRVCEEGSAATWRCCATPTPCATSSAPALA
jgi:hypothetical protein